MAENIIELKIGDLELRCRGADDWPQTQLEQALLTVKRCLPEAVVAGEPQQASKRQVPRAEELLEISSARTFGDKAGVVAFWLQTHGGRSRWRSGEIVDVLREAGEAVPSNITDALNHKRQKGLFETKDRMWWLTDQGVGWVRYALLNEKD